MAIYVRIKLTPLIRYVTIFTLFILCSFNGISQESKIQWSPEEKHWIENHQEISFGYEPHWEPYEIYENGEYSGIVGEYVKIIEKETGINLKPIPNLTWKKSLNGLQNGTIQMVPCCAITPSREKFLHFSNIYIEDPIVIVVRKNGPYMSTLEDLKNKKIALSRNYYTIELIKEKYPDIEINEKETIKECLESVTSGESVAFVGNLNVITYHMNHMGFGNLAVVGTTPFETGNIAMAVNNELQPFIPIINKVISNISAKEKHNIRREWIAESENESFLNTQFMYWTIIILSGIFVSLTLLYYWNNVLRKIVRRKKKTEQRLKESLVELKKNDEEKKVLLQEIHHRVKNNLQVVSSMMRLQANINNNEVASKTLLEAVERIKTIALVHDRIYKSPKINTVKLNDYISSLFCDIMLQFSGLKKPEFKMNELDADVNMDKIVPLALILNELITNSIKYAYDDQKNPEISIQLSTPKSSGLELIYSDNGKWKEENNSDRFGTSLIEIFTEQLDGVYDLKKSKNGTSYHFKFNTLIIQE